VRILEQPGNSELMSVTSHQLLVVNFIRLPSPKVPYEQELGSLLAPSSSVDEGCRATWTHGVIFGNCNE